MKFPLKEEQIKEVEELFNHFQNELNADLLNAGQKRTVIEMRSLFSTLLKKKYKFKNCQIKKYYEHHGLVFNHATITHSLKNFDVYCSSSSIIEEVYFNFYDYEKRVKKAIEKEKKLTYIQKLVTNLEPWQELELEQLIELKIKSWSWKNKDKTTIYTAN